MKSAPRGFRCGHVAWFCLVLALIAASTAHASEVSVPAFGGHLLGTDRGEWIGELAFVDPDGTRQVLLRDNVFGISSNGTDAFVIVGLAHGSENRGAVHRLARATDGTLEFREVIPLVGSPSQVRTYSDGSADFLVFEGWLGEHRHFRCYRLANAVVKPANTCAPPR